MSKEDKRKKETKKKRRKGEEEKEGLPKMHHVDLSINRPVTQ